MPRKCLTCSHKKVKQINKLLIDGRTTLDSISDKFGIGRIPLHTHRKRCIPEKYKAAMEKKDGREGIDLHDELSGLVKVTKEILDRAKKDDENELALRAIARLEKQFELIAKLLGQINDGSTVNVNINAEMVEFRAIVVNVVKRFPEAHSALINALREESGTIEDAER
jgi:hypothetical protein